MLSNKSYAVEVEEIVSDYLEGHISKAEYDRAMRAAKKQLKHRRPADKREDASYE